MKTNFDFSRRQLLQAAGVSALPWMTPLADALAINADTKAGAKSQRRPKSLIVVWLQGGASQIDTFDPHPGKKISYGAKAIPTSVKGLQYADALPQTAEMARHFSTIRSTVSKEGDHARAIYNIKSGYRPVPGLVHPAIGSVLCHQLPNSQLDIPAHVSIFPGQFPSRGGFLGPSFDAFKMGDPQGPVPGVKARVDDKRQQERLAALNMLESNFAKGRIKDLDTTRTLHQTNTSRALDMMSSEQLDAFDISEVPAATKKKFGDSPFGRGCLAAIQLVEAGVRCIEVTLNGWDSHANNKESQRKRVDTLDPALASLFGELIERELYDDTIVLCASEFGRTPKMNAVEGRDHWPHGFSTLLGGGGLVGGQVIGGTDPEGEKKKPSDPVNVEDIHATIYEALHVDIAHEFMTPIGRPIAISEGYPLEALL